MKTFICSICGKEVTKPKSYAMDDGSRACREHPEAIKCNERRESRRKTEAMPVKKREINEREYTSFMNRPNPQTFCWHCERKGVSEQLLNERILINMHKHKIVTGETVNLFDMSNPVYQTVMKELKGSAIIKRFPISKEYPKWKLDQIIKERDLKDIPHFVGFLVLCAECAKNFKFDWNWDKPKDIPLETMLLLGSLMEEPLDNLAKEELAMTN